VEEVGRLLEEIVLRDEDSCLFGADEGLPGFSDPGKSLLAAAAALGARLRVCTIAGPSALAMALLRIPLNLDHFMFLGVLEDDPVGVVERFSAQHNTMPLIHFLTGDVDAVARRIAAAFLPLGREVFLACNLTCDNEKILHLRSDEDLVSLPPLDPTTRTIVIVGPAMSR